MLKRNNGQLGSIDQMIFDKLIPKNHLLVKINAIVDFSFVYDKVQDKYSHLGRGSKDPSMMLKILLLEYLYKLSDVEIVKRIQTDVAFRWFLKLGLDNSVPDDTTISHFRVNRLGEEDYNEFFDEIVKQCIEKNLIKSKRYMIDSTDVAANVNYPSNKKLIRNAYRKVIKEIEKFDEELAKKQLDIFENEIELEYQKNEKVNWKRHFEIANNHLNYLYLKTYDELQDNEKYKETFGVCYDIIDQYTNNKGDRIVSVVDPDARVAHKSVGNIKRGYKNHIIVDEDSEIILASVQTPFNVNDEKKLKELVEKVNVDLNLKPKEISADKAYGTIENRAYLKDSEIVTNIDFYNKSSKEKVSFGLDDFKIAEDVESVICPNGIKTTKYKFVINNGKKYKRFKIDQLICEKCKLRDECLSKNKAGKITVKSKFLLVPERYDSVLRDRKRVETKEFKEAINKRSKVERRFATLVLNHGLRRCRYLRLKRTKIHITLANMACNIIRMVNLLCHPSIATS